MRMNRINGHDLPTTTDDGFHIAPTISTTTTS